MMTNLEALYDALTLPPVFRAVTDKLSFNEDDDDPFKKD